MYKLGMIILKSILTQLHCTHVLTWDQSVTGHTIHCWLWLTGEAACGDGIECAAVITEADAGLFWT